MRRWHSSCLSHPMAMLINLMGDLHVTIDANYFLHRDTEVDELGVKSERQVGLGYTWGRKWF